MGGKRARWSASDVDILRRLEGADIKDVAATLGRRPQEVRLAARRLDIAITVGAPRRKANPPKVLLERECEDDERFEAPARCLVHNGDERHVARCLAHGGFVRVELIAGRPVHVWPEGARR